MVDEVVTGEDVTTVRLAGQVRGGDGDQLAFPGRACQTRRLLEDLSGLSRVTADQLADQRLGIFWVMAAALPGALALR